MEMKTNMHSNIFIYYYNSPFLEIYVRSLLYSSHMSSGAWTDWLIKYVLFGGYVL